MKQEINLQINYEATVRAITVIIDSHLKKSFKTTDDWEYIQEEIIKLGKIADYYREEQLKKESETA